MPAETPNTLTYLVAGYVVFWLVTFVFVISLVARTRNLEKDVEVLRSLLEEEQKDEAAGREQQAIGTEQSIARR